MAARRAAAAADSLKSDISFAKPKTPGTATLMALYFLSRRNDALRKGALMSVDKLSPLPLSRDFDNVPMRRRH